jgi:hypothetical protein
MCDVTREEILALLRVIFEYSREPSSFRSDERDAVLLRHRKVLYKASKEFGRDLIDGMWTELTGWVLEYL